MERPNYGYLGWQYAKEGIKQRSIPSLLKASVGLGEAVLPSTSILLEKQFHDEYIYGSGIEAVIDIVSLFLPILAGIETHSLVAHLDQTLSSTITLGITGGVNVLKNLALKRIENKLH